MALENLDELMTRRTRRATATWGYAYVEDGTSRIWQPETVMYHDTTTGKEVWKVSNTPSLSSVYHDDIGVTPWSANGAKLAFATPGRFTGEYNQALQTEWASTGWWLTVNTDGTAMRPTVEAARRLAGSSSEPYFHWHPQLAGTWIALGENHLGSSGVNTKLYRMVVDSVGAVSTTEILSAVPTGAAGTPINKLLSANGKKIILEASVAAKWFPISIATDAASATADDADGYALDRDYGLYGDMTAAAVTAHHDQYPLGLGDWFMVMPSGTSTWWRIKTIGTAADGGPLYTGNDGEDDFGEVWPENYGALTGGNTASPFCSPTTYNASKCTYWSHFCPDRWGRHALFSNVEGDGVDGLGTGVWDFINHVWVVTTMHDEAQHHSWNGFTDWVASSGGEFSDSGLAAVWVLAGKYDERDTQFRCCNAHSRVYGGTSYSSLIRPGQSPDGTKIAFHSEFLNAADKADVFWVEVCKPYPPTDLEAADGAGTSIDIGFLPPTYTSRKWINRATGLIDEASGETLYAREVKRYHLWRSTTGSSGWTLVNSIDATYDNHATSGTLIPTFGGTEVDAGNPIQINDDPGNGTWYYAVTTEEHSGLESDELSEILSVTISGSPLAQSIHAVQGQTDFWTAAPSVPTGFSATPTAVPGHCTLEWTEPGDAKVRHYNLYYSETTTPTATQQMRIASVPAGTASILDWLADDDVSGIYGITSVDRYGNESDIVLSRDPVLYYVFSAGGTYFALSTGE